MSAKIAYRRDIDGLRTIAVASVVVYHAFPALVPGGFVGVDIFFVISGFLITGILVREHERSGRIDLFDFYARRVRRLLPALLVVVATTLALALWLTPATGELQSVARSALAALFFVSNLFFTFQPSGYFAQAAETYPLLHTWTLAVEEQFYIVWPLLIPVAVWLGAKVGLARQRALWTLFVTMFVVSLALSVVATTLRPGYAFYLTPFRAWEFAIGAMLSLVLHGDRPRWRHGAAALSVVGLFLIGLSLWSLDRGTPFPGWIALLPTLGAAALLAAGAIAPANPVARLLAAPPAVYVGKLSYGWYLWHWPLLAFVRGDALGEASATAIVAAVVVSFLLSAVSYHVIETPIRLQRPRIFRTTGSSLIAGVALLLTGAAAAGATIATADRTLAGSPRLQAIAGADKHLVARARSPECSNYQAIFRAFAPAEACLIGDPAAKNIVILIGDSHAAHLMPMLDRWGRAAGVAILPRARAGCRPLDGIAQVIGEPGKSANSAQIADCARFRAAAFGEAAELAARGRTTTIVAAARWPNAAVEGVAERDRAAFDAGFVTGLARLAQTARKARLRLVLIQDTPLFEYHVPRCLARRADAVCARQSVLAAPDRARARARARIAALAGVAIVDPSLPLCPNGVCPPIRGGVVMFTDAHHLSSRGSAALAGPLKPALDAAILGR